MEQVIGAALEWNETRQYVVESGGRLKAGLRAQFWNAHRHRLNNSLLLCQQAMELDLKARIATIDPFLLLVGKAAANLRQKGGNFLEAPTVGARELPAEVARICKGALDTAYVNLFHKMRVERNRIAHLHGCNFPAEARQRLEDLLSVFEVIHAGKSWQTFCRTSMVAGGKDGPATYGDDDWTFSHWLRKFEAALDLLDVDGAKRHFGFDKRRLQCPSCSSERARHDEEIRNYAQLQAGGSIACAACLAVYPSRDAYEQEGGDWDE